MKKIMGMLTLVLCWSMAGFAQNLSDTSKVQRDLYVVATSHLDTQWRWTIQNTINEYVPATFRDNFKLMDLYPDYKFSFEGAFKYMLFKEYHPDEYAKLKGYIDRGQWNLAGSWVDAVDVNMPSFESLVRQTLYGNGYFKKEFGKTSKDILLPDCFGFGYALPSIAAHCGLESFSTQKLTWGCSVPVPFDIGLWQGVDSSSIVAALRPGDYVSKIRGDLTRDSTWTARINAQGEKSGLYAAYRYFGTGDTGGSPDSLSVDWLSKSLKSDGPVKVHSIGSDGITNVVTAKTGPVYSSYISDAFKRSWNLPRYNGELLMTRHGVGCYTSEAAMKRWNRKNELLADATERACVIANLVAGEPYPKEDLKNTWIRFLWHQFHDDLTGTSIPEAYQFSWNDELLCQNRFSQILTHAVEATAAVMDTRVKGIPIVVYNPLSISREDIVEATIPCKNTINDKESSFMPFRVYDQQGKEVPSSVVECDHIKNIMTISFIAKAPSVGYAVYDICPAQKPCDMETGLNATENSIENNRYLVKLNDKGEVASIYDKINNRQLLSAPIKLQFLHDKPGQWPAWEIQYEDIVAPPMTGIIKNTKIEIVDAGPVKASLLVTQKTDNSTIRTTISLAAGEAGDRIEFDNDVDWYERETLLKAAFNFAAPNDSVTYDIGLGTISRGINTPKKYEVPGQQWADMTSKDGSYGVAVLNDCKYGWDHPDSATLRLSLIHTPGVYESWNWVGDEKSQDNGHHNFKYAITGHKGDWRDGGVVWQAARLNQPQMGFVTTVHKGMIGKSFALLNSASRDKNNPQVKVTAIKQAENSDETVIRVQELWGNPANDASISIASGITNEINKVSGVESKIGGVQVKQKEYFAPIIKTAFTPYQPQAFALSFSPYRFATEYGSETEYGPRILPLQLPFNLDGISFDSNRKDGEFDAEGNTISGDLLPDTLTWLGVPYVLGPKADGQKNVMACNEQILNIPQGKYDAIYFLATATSNPTFGLFATYSMSASQKVLQGYTIPNYSLPIGQWNSRISGDELVEEPPRIEPGYVNNVPVAWYGTHRHTAKGEDEAYRFTYLYLLKLILPDSAKVLLLPDDPGIKILAATLVKLGRAPIKPKSTLFSRENPAIADIHSEHHSFIDSTLVTITSPNTGRIYYTTDGSDPVIDFSFGDIQQNDLVPKPSPEYTGPFYVKDTAVIKARAFRAYEDSGYVAQASFHKLIPHEATLIKKALPGLNGRYFEGTWDKLPKFDTVKVVKEFTANSVAVPDFARKEDFGLLFDGYLKVPSDGLYDFYLSSDDGSFLYIGDSLVVNNDGLHGTGDVPGEIALKAGYHRISVPMFQAKGDEGLELSIQGPGLEKQAIPKSMLFHSAEKTRR